MPVSAPKSTCAIDLSPSPSTRTTVPRPKESWLTRSPDWSAMTGRLPALRTPGRAASVATAGRSEPRAPLNDGPSRCQSSRSPGISSRKRDGGLYCGAPQADRTAARER